VSTSAPSDAANRVRGKAGVHPVERARERATTPARRKRLEREKVRADHRRRPLALDEGDEATHVDPIERVPQRRGPPMDAGLFEPLVEQAPDAGGPTDERVVRRRVAAAEERRSELQGVERADVRGGSEPGHRQLQRLRGTSMARPGGRVEDEDP